MALESLTSNEFSTASDVVWWRKSKTRNQQNLKPLTDECLNAVVLRSVPVGADHIGPAALRWSRSFRDGELPQRWLPTVAASQLPRWTVRSAPVLLRMESYPLTRFSIPCFSFAVMACCWIANPSKRPTFLQLLACLQDFHTALGRFIWLLRFDRWESDRNVETDAIHSRRRGTLVDICKR